MLLQAAGNEIQVIFLNDVGLFFLLDDEGVDLQGFLVVLQLIIRICELRNVLLDEIVQVLMNGERQPLAVAVVEPEQIGEDVLLLPIRKILHQGVLIHVAVLEQHRVFVSLRPDDYIEQDQLLREGVHQSCLLIDQIKRLIISHRFEVLDRGFHTSAPIFLILKASLYTKSMKPTRNIMTSLPSSSLMSSRQRREWIITNSSPRRYCVMVKALGRGSLR